MPSRIFRGFHGIYCPPSRQWSNGGKALIYYKTKAVLWFQGEESLTFNFCPSKDLFLATTVRRLPSQVEALGVSIVEARSAKRGGGTVLVVAAKARNIIEVHHMLAHPSADTRGKTAEAMGIATTGQQ